jgi:hypothetical protein
MQMNVNAHADGAAAVCSGIEFVHGVVCTAENDKTAFESSHQTDNYSTPNTAVQHPNVILDNPPCNANSKSHTKN